MQNKEGSYHLDENLAKFQAVGSDSFIAKLLRGQGNINENVIRQMCNEVAYADLSALKTDDLELFGINNKDTQSQLVSEFSTLTNQEQSLKRLLSGLKAADYQEKIHCQVQNQLSAIAIVLEAIEQSTDADWNNILVKPNAYISIMILRALGQISERSNAIQMKKRSNVCKWICGGAVLALFCAAKKMM